MNVEYLGFTINSNESLICLAKHSNTYELNLVTKLGKECYVLHTMQHKIGTNPTLYQEVNICAQASQHPQWIF